MSHIPCKSRESPLFTHWHSCRSPEFSCVVLELILGRHIKLLEVIYPLTLIPSKGSARMETAFMSTGVHVLFSSKCFSERYSSIPGGPGEEN